jgi:hypothetical protein
MTNRALNAQAVLLARKCSYSDSIRICESHGASVEPMPDSSTSGRDAIAYFSDGSRIEISDARPTGFEP